MANEKFVNLETALTDFRMELELSRTLPSAVLIPQDHIPTQPRWLMDTIKAAESLGIMRKGQRVLEMGFGIGSAAFTFNYMGYGVVGYELDGVLFESAGRLKTQLLESRVLEPNLECDLRHGSYFPPEYVELLRQQKARGIPTSEETGASIEPNEIEYLHIVPGPITPEELRTFDILYAYPWRSQFPSFVELFSLYAREDAVLLLKSPGWHQMMGKVLRDYRVRHGGAGTLLKIH